MYTHFWKVDRRMGQNQKQDEENRRSNRTRQTNERADRKVESMTPEIPDRGETSGVFWASRYRAAMTPQLDKDTPMCAHTLSSLQGHS